MYYYSKVFADFSFVYIGFAHWVSLWSRTNMVS